MNATFPGHLIIEDRSIRSRTSTVVGLIFGALCGVLPVPGSDAAAAAEDAKEETQAVSPAAAAIARLLDADTSPGKARLETVRPLYDEALRKSPRDARVEYAYSLVLQKMFKSGEAREHLKRAQELDPDFLPANQAAIRELLKARKFTEAAERLADLGLRLDPERPESAAAAEWLGRIVGAVIAALGTPDAQAQYAYLDRVIRMSQSPLLLSSYEKGFRSVQRELEELTELIDSARSSAEVKRESVKAELDAELKKDQNEIKLKQQETQKTRQKWDEWIADQTAKADDLLREQEKRYQDLDNAITAQQASVTALRLTLEGAARDFSALQELRTQQQQRSPITRNLLNVSGPSVDSLQLQLALEERRLAALYDQQAGVAREATQTVAARRNAVAAYQRATGIALKDAANIDRWEKRNKAVAENMKKAAEKKPAQVATLEARIKSLNTWDPADFETEKRRLLADLGISDAKK